MDRRTSFLCSDESQIDVKRFVSSSHAVQVNNINCAREESVTIQLSAVPAGLRTVLEGLRKFHARWRSEQPFHTTLPLAALISPGLHINVEPLEEYLPPLLCSELRKLFAQKLDCEPVNHVFSTQSDGDVRTTSNFVFYSRLSSLKQFAHFLQQLTCRSSDRDCIHSLALLNIADTLDVDFDISFQAVTFKAFWPQPPPFFYDIERDVAIEKAWSVSLRAAEKDKHELGILHASTPTEVHDIQLSGLLLTAGQGSQPRSTQFQFASRHHALSSLQPKEEAFQVVIDEPTGLHPNLKITFPNATALKSPSEEASAGNCALYAYLTLPKAIFADKYQLLTKDPMFLAAHNLVALRSISGETDLEAPDYVVKIWGSNLLLELRQPMNTEQHLSTMSWQVSIPLHLRYKAPTSNGKSEVVLPWPVIFWACNAGTGIDFSVNPFDRVNLGYNTLFEPHTVFYHVPPRYDAVGGNQSMTISLDIPSADLTSVGSIPLEFITLSAIMLGFLWICRQLWPGLKQLALRDLSGAQHYKKQA